MRGRSQPGPPGCPLTRSQSCPAEAQLRWSRSRPGPPAPGLPLPVGRPLLPWLVLRTEPGELWEAPGQNGRLTRVAAAPVQSHRVPVRETLCRAGEAAAGAPGGTPGRGVPVQREQRPVADGEGGHQPELGRPLCPPGKGEWHGRAQLSPRPAGLSACAGGAGGLRPSSLLLHSLVPGPSRWKSWAAWRCRRRPGRTVRRRPCWVSPQLW